MDSCSSRNEFSTIWSGVIHFSRCMLDLFSSASFAGSVQAQRVRTQSVRAKRLIAHRAVIDRFSFFTGVDNVPLGSALQLFVSGHKVHLQIRMASPTTQIAAYSRAHTRANAVAMLIPHLKARLIGGSIVSHIRACSRLSSSLFGFMLSSRANIQAKT